MFITLIAAVSENRVIGRSGALPWRLSADLRRFKRLTVGHTVIMGRRTQESIGRPLPERRTIVVSRNPAYRPDGVEVARSFEEALDRGADGDEAVFILGGGEVYRQALARADRLELTIVHAEVEGDTYFPEYDEAAWTLVADERHEADERNEFPYSFRTYARARAG